MRWAGAAGVLLVAAGAGCGQTPPPEEPIRPVRYVEVTPESTGIVRTFSGTMQAGTESRLSFKVSGTIQSIPVKLGDSVRPGALIAALDPRDYQLQVDDAEASLAQARARLRNAESSLDRVRGLYENNNASRADYDAARAERDSASAQVESLTTRLQLARSQLSYARLTAPIEGAISAVNVDVNENVSPGQTVVVLTSRDSPEVQVAVSEDFIAQVDVGQAARVTLDALPGRSFEALVSEVAATASGLATTFPVKVRLRSSPPEVRPGMAAEVAFRTDPGAAPRIVVPGFAVGEDRQGRFVYVVEPAGEGRGVVHRRAVEVGRILPEGIEIPSGLSEGDRVVTAGVSRLEDGQEVKLPAGSPGGS